MTSENHSESDMMEEDDDDNDDEEEEYEYAYSSDDDEMIDGQVSSYAIDDNNRSTITTTLQNKKMAFVVSSPNVGSSTTTTTATTTATTTSIIPTDNPNTPPNNSNNHHHNNSSSQNSIQMVNANDLRPIMIQRCQEICELLNISMISTAFIILQHYHWNKEQLLDQYMNTENSDSLLQQIGIYHRCCCGSSTTSTTTSNNNAAMNMSIQDTATLQTCFICYEETNEMLSMPCGHAFCYDCWTGFCINAVQDGPSCVISTCPYASCTEIVTDTEFQIALQQSEPDVYIKYMNYQLRNFVESNPYTRWCPGRGCDRVAYATSSSILEQEDGTIAKCDACYTKFCLLCGEEPHAPASCKQLCSWNEKCKNESETANWILANTKSCPKCCCRIEKNQGCNHMSCQKCKYEFCWVCMGDWKDHGANTGGYYKCNRFDNPSDDTSKQTTNDPHDAANKAKRELDRYLHYYSRFYAHSEAQNFAQKQLKATEYRMSQLQEVGTTNHTSSSSSTTTTTPKYSSSSIHHNTQKTTTTMGQHPTTGTSGKNDVLWSDVEFLKAANEQLIECRRVLKYTYIYAYYMDTTSTETTTATTPVNNPVSSNTRKMKQSSSSSTTNQQANTVPSNQQQPSSSSLLVQNQQKLNRERFEHHQEMLERFTENLSELSEQSIYKMDRTDIVNQTRVVNKFVKNILHYVADGMID